MIQGTVAPDESELWRVYTPDHQPSCSGSQGDLPLLLIHCGMGSTVIRKARSLLLSSRGR
jgi:hypothetical protein